MTRSEAIAMGVDFAMKPQLFPGHEVHHLISARVAVHSTIAMPTEEGYLDVLAEIGRSVEPLFVSIPDYTSEELARLGR